MHKQQGHNTHIQTNTLAVSQPSSPGSSVFDLPTQRTLSPLGNSNGAATRNLQPSLSLESPSSAEDATLELSCIVLSGGTGGNAICSAFTRACFVLPVSDDGGSSSEIIRVLGGPSIGDVRSRLIRLIPNPPPSSPLDAIRRLLSYRLPATTTAREARDIWRDIVEGHSDLWTGIPNDRKETIRGFLVYFESELLKRAHKNFDFRNGSIGNYFLAAAQYFFRSLPSAIFLFSSITNSQATILPVIVTNHTVTIAAELEDGRKLVGQCEISHPVPKDDLPPTIEISEDPMSPTDGIGEVISQRQNFMFEHTAKDSYEALGSRIDRLYYINAYGMEIHPSPNPDYIAHLASNDVLVYSCGSLWTSIIPSLALRGVAAGIARSRSLRSKILLLNPTNDRETDGYSAVDYIKAIIRTLNSSYQAQPYGLGGVNTTYPVSAFITDIVYLKTSEVSVDVGEITRLGVRCTPVDGAYDGATRFDADIVRYVIRKVLGSRA